MLSRLASSSRRVAAGGRGLGHKARKASQRHPQQPRVLLQRQGASVQQLQQLQLQQVRWSSSKAPSTLSAADQELAEHILRSVAGTSEVEYYLEKFRTFQGSAFAVVKVGGDVVEYDLDDLTQTCLCLWQAGLKPVVIHGGGPQMNDELARQGVEPQYIDGSRVTDAETLAVAERIFTELNARVVAAFEKAGMKAKAFPSGVFRAEVARPELGFVGEVQGVNPDELEAALADNVVPVLTSLGRSSEGQVLNINADVAARDLVHTLQPMRVLFASFRGGWIDDDTGKIVRVVDMANEYEGLANRDYEGRQGTLLKLNEIKLILEGVPDSTAVAITAADSMLEELFTHQGAGSLFTKGLPVQRVEGDAAASCPLLEPVTEGEVDATYYYGPSLEHAYAAARVVRYPNLGKDLPPVLYDLELDPTHKGNGHEMVLWKMVQQDYPSLAWSWTVAEEKEGNLRCGSRSADGTMCHWASDSNVAWYNRGHPLTGWSADKAPRLMVDRSTPNTKSVSSYSYPDPATSEQPVKKLNVGLLGARGYVGREFVKLLTQHPNMDLTVASSRALKGQRVIDCFGLDKSAADRGVAETLLFDALEPDQLAHDEASQNVDIWVLALPNGLAPKFVDALETFAKDATFIDLGADYRFDDSWVYGLPERPGARDGLRGAKRIANPGCYATGAQVALMPLMQPKGDQNGVRIREGTVPTVFGVSGYSGAGTNPSDKNDPHCLKDNLLPYALVNHMHENECSRHLGSQIAFMPHVAPYFQGIHLTTSAHLATDGGVPDADAVLSAYESYYEGEALIKVSKEAPLVRDNMWHHHAAVGGFTVDEKTGRLAVVSTVDNLLLGAASQACKNLNLAHGIDEYTGLIDVE